jgi:hypothetical protein
LADPSDATEALLAELAGLGIQLRLEGEALRFTAPAGALTPEIRTRLQAAKPAVTEYLRSSDSTLLPASLVQRRFWELQQLDPDWSFYNVPFLFQLQGPVDPAILRRSLDAIVMRHESLRTTLHRRDGKLMQVIAGAGAADWLEADMDGASDDDIRGFLRQQVLRRYDLARDQILRGVLVRTGADAWLFQICLHNVVFDLSSILVILDEVSRHYTAFAAGRDPALPAPVQYAEYVRWQAASVASGMDRRRVYWQNWLSNGEPPPWSWPQRAEPATQAGFHSLPTWARLSPEDHTRLQAFCRANGVTVYIAMLTAYFLATRQMTGCADLTIGTTYSDRDASRFASMIGASIVVPALRVDMSGDPALPELLLRVREALAASLTNQDLPIDEVLPRDAKGPLFRMVCTAFPETPHGKLRLGNVKATWLEEWLNPISRPTLYLVIWETPGQAVQGQATQGQGAMALTCHMMHRQDVWDSGTAKDMMTTFETIVRSMAATPL